MALFTDLPRRRGYSETGSVVKLLHGMSYIVEDPTAVCNEIDPSTCRVRRNTCEGPRRKHDALIKFDEVTNGTIELIDVLWLRGNAIVAAFEIESTISIYSGLLRMSDLITRQPNLNIPLYLVAPDERRDKVIAEVNRPTFSRRSPPMNRICSFISFSTLRQNMERVAGMTRYLKPEFLQELAEPCVPDET